MKRVKKGKGILTAVLVVALSALLTPGQGTGSTFPLQLSLEGQMSGNPEIAAAGRHVYVVWEDQASRNIFFTKSHNKGDSFDTPVNLSQSTHSNNPNVAASGPYVYVQWTEDSYNDQIRLRYSTDYGRTFSESILIPPFTCPGFIDWDSARIAASGNTVHVAWIRHQQGQCFSGDPIPSGTYLFYWRVMLTGDGAEVGGFRFIDAEANFPELAVSGDKVYLAWATPWPYSPWFAVSTDNGYNFQTARIEQFRSGKMAASGRNVYLLLKDDADHLHLAISTSGGDNFDDPDLVTTDLTTALGIRSVYDFVASGDNLYLYGRESSTGPHTFWSSADNGATFSQPIVLNPNRYGCCPKIAASGSYVHVADVENLWSDTEVFLYQSVDYGQSFVSATNLSDSPDAWSDRPQIAAFGKNAYVAWQEHPQAQPYPRIMFARATPSQAGADWYVKMDGSDGSIGISWEHAFQTIHRAIEMASDGDEIWVGQGTYSLSSQINVNKAISIYGGFNGTETTRDQRNWKSNQTIVDGNGGSRCFKITADATISGFTITNGYASGADWLEASGGGIWVEGSSPTIEYSTIIGNEASNGHGGGILITDDPVSDACSYPTIRNCIIRGNIADYSPSGYPSYGGGIFSFYSGPAIINSVIGGNTADLGGGIYFYFCNPTYCSSPATVTNGTITNNMGAEGGGIYSHQSDPTITNSVLWADSGGEIYVTSAPHSPNVTYCDVQGGYSGTGNIGDDPLLVDPANGNFHLQAGSPCIDAGTNSAPWLPSTDFDGEPRIANGTADIGADESFDSDGDGISDAVEDGASNSGDGNSDGTPDGEQENVASLPNAVDGSYVTIASPSGTMLTNVHTVENPSPTDAPTGVDFPDGFFEFTIEGLVPGGAATVSFYSANMGAYTTYYKYGPTPDYPTPHWYPFMFDGTTGAEILADRTVLHFVDGERGDDDLTPDGIVVEPGGPGIRELTAVDIDIRPFSRHNVIVPWKWGLVPVAILSTADFDAPEMVDRKSLTFGPTGDEQSRAFCLRRGWDVNRDGLRDLVAFFRTKKTGFQVGDTEGILRGLTVAGVPIEGRDSVKVKEKKKWSHWKKR